MEFINKIEIQGIVGSCNVRKVGGTSVANITIATNQTFQGPNGITIETTWHSVKCWSGKNIADLDSLRKGDGVRITGRLRNEKYISTTGEEIHQTSILATSLSKVAS